MKEQIEKNIDNAKLKTIFFGGGTPSLMPPEIIETILNKVTILLSCDIEITKG